MPIESLERAQKRAPQIIQKAVVVQSLSHVWLFVTPWTHQTSLSITISQNLLKLMSIESVMPSNHLILCRLLLILPSIFPSIRAFFQCVSSLHQVAKVLEPQAFQWIFIHWNQIQCWFTLGLTGLTSLQSKELSIVLSSTTIQKHQFFGTQPSLWYNSHIHTWLLEKPCAYSLSHVWLCDPMNSSPPGSSVHGDFPGKTTGVVCHAFLQGIFPTQGSNPGLPHCRRILYCLSHQGSPGKTIALTIWTFVDKVTSLLFTTLSGFATTFLPLISWLQSPSTVILEPEKRKSATLSIFSPSICHEMMGPDTMILVFWTPSLSSRGSSVPLCFLPLGWYHLHFWGCWYFWQSWFQFVIHPAWHFSWCSLHIS